MKTTLAQLRNLSTFRHISIVGTGSGRLFRLRGRAIQMPAKMTTPPAACCGDIVSSKSTQAKRDTFQDGPFRETAEIQQCYRVTGDTDYVLVMLVAAMADYEELSHWLVYENPNVKKFKTFVAMDRVKAGVTVPIDAP